MAIGLQSGSPLVGTLDTGADEFYSQSLTNVTNGCGVLGIYVSNATGPTVTAFTVGGEAGTVVIQQVARSTRLAVCYLSSFSGTTGTKTVQVTYSAAVLSVSGACIALDTAVSVDDSDSGTGTSLSMTATVANAFGLVAGISGFGELTADTGWTGLSLPNVWEYESGQYIADLGASGSKTVTMQTNTVQGLAAALFRPASGGGGTVIPVFMNQYRQRWKA